MGYIYIKLTGVAKKKIPKFSMKCSLRKGTHLEGPKSGKHDDHRGITFLLMSQGLGIYKYTSTACNRILKRLAVYLL